MSPSWTHLNWQQMAFYAAGRPNHHEQGMRVECDWCGVVAYTGDSAEGDREAARVRVEHRCPEWIDTYQLEI